MSTDKTNPKYKNNPKLHLRDLYTFRDRLYGKILGEQSDEWRGELQFLIERTNKKITEIRYRL